MESNAPSQEDVRRYLRETLESGCEEILRGISRDEGPSYAYFRFLKTNRRRYFMRYLDSLGWAIESGDGTDFLGNETFEGYKCAEHGLSLREIVEVPQVIRAAVGCVLTRRAEESPDQGILALRGKQYLDGLLDQASVIRAQSIVQTKEEIVHFFHSSQEEIDRFPENLAATLDLDTLLESASRELLDLVPARKCVFLERELATEKLYVLFANFDHIPVLGQGGLELDAEILKNVFREGIPYLVERRKLNRPLVSSLMKRMEAEALLVVPLKVRGRTVGVVLLDSGESTHPFRPDLVELAGRFCNQVAAAMENAKIHQSEQKKIKETLTLLEIARIMNSALDVDTLLSRVAQTAVQLSGIRMCTVYLRVDEENYFYLTASYSEAPGVDWETPVEEKVRWEDLGDEEAELLRQGKEIWITEPAASPFLPEGMEGMHDIRSLLIIPLSGRGETSGLVVYYCTNDAEEVEDEWLSLCSAITGQAAVALENVSLYEKIERSYYNTVMALASAIEVKDPYTYGHSEKVTDFAMAIGRRMDLNQDQLRTLKYGSTLHDVGKIGISGEVLNKPGPLTDEEFAHVRSHTELGDQIMAPVEFLQEPRPIVRSHHERYDGQGFPDGLSGEDIPLMARIVSVADAFEAMLSERPYRRALPFQEAVAELVRNTDSQFDPQVVKVLLEVLKKEKMEEEGAYEESAASQEPKS